MTWIFDFKWKDCRQNYTQILNFFSWQRHCDKLFDIWDLISETEL